MCRSQSAVPGVATLPRIRSGFVLIEVLVAVAILSILLAPLFSVLLRLRSAAEGTGRRVASGDARLAEDGGVVGADAGRRMWTWSSARVVRAEPVEEGIRVWVCGPAGGESIEVGLWAHGWFAGSVTVDPSEAGSITVPVTADLSPSTEMVLRAREPGGGWGVPWRTVWTDPPVLPISSGADLSGLEPAHEGQTVAVVHSRAAGVSSLRLRSGVAPPTEASLSLPAEFVVNSGATEVGCDGFEQALWGAPGRLVHLYF